jgi:hypothetical protein
MRNHWDEQQNKQRRNQHCKVMLASLRDAEPSENPAGAKIDFQGLGPAKRFQNNNSLALERSA